MDITLEQVQGKAQITVVHVKGRVDGTNYHDLIAKAAEAYTAGARNLLIDLSDVPYMSSAGLAAIQSIVQMSRGEKPIGEEAGWDALHSINREESKGQHTHVKLLKPQPGVDKVLDLAGIKNFLPVFTDRDAAIASF